MKNAISKARKRPKLAAPSVSRAAMRLVETAGPAYARLVLKLASMSFRGAEHFVESVRDFYDGKARLIIAFRHPYGDEPQVFMYAMHWGLVSEARRLGRPLSHRPHCFFLHGYEVPLWSGGLVRWILPRTGSMPVYHVRQETASIRAIRGALLDGSHPLALAPEGQVSYRSETLPRLERGALQFGFWCAQDLARADRPERMLILPVSVHAQYDDSGIGILEAMARDLERRTGLRPLQAAPDGSGAGVSMAARRRALGLRLRRIDLSLIDLGERYYELRPPAEADGDEAAAIAHRESRRRALLEEALRRGEGMLGVKPEGDLINRVYRLRHEGWSRIFPETDLDALAPLERELADRKAAEAWHAMRHMELVDLGFYLDAPYLEDGLKDGGAPSIGRLAETVSSLADLASRLTGGDISDRPNPLKKEVVLVAREPLELRSRLADYTANRLGTVERAERDLALSYGSAVREYLDSP